jgi:hypothetical protein
MMRKFTACLVFFASTCFILSSCNDDEPATPPKSSVTVNPNSGLAFDTEFTFTVDQVNADAISLLPYGKENGAWGGVLITSFTGGKATVKFKYEQVGVFEAVVVSNNHNATGDVSNTYSDPVTVTVTSDRKKITAFWFNDADKDKTVIDEAAKTITVTVPYEANATTPTDVTKLKAKFESSAFSKVSVSGAEQKSGETVVNFSSPVTYTVTAHNGTTTTYEVTVTRAPIEQNPDVKSATGIEKSKSAKDKEIPAYVDNTSRIIVLYDVLETSLNDFDSVNLKYTLDGSWSHAILEGKTAHLKADDLIDLKTAPKELTVYSQDSVNVSEVYTVYAVQAPKLTLKFTDKDPEIVGTNSGFTIEMKVLKEADKSYKTEATIEEPNGGVGITATIESVNGDTSFASGDDLDFTEDQKFVIKVVDTNLGITYRVTYTATLNEF